MTLSDRYSDHLESLDRKAFEAYAAWRHDHLPHSWLGADWTMDPDTPGQWVLESVDGCPLMDDLDLIEDLEYLGGFPTTLAVLRALGSQTVEYRASFELELSRLDSNQRFALVDSLEEQTDYRGHSWEWS